MATTKDIKMKIGKNPITRVRKARAKHSSLALGLTAISAAAFILNLTVQLTSVPVPSLNLVCSCSRGCQLNQPQHEHRNRTTPALGHTSSALTETAAICAIVKDEQLYLEEWVLYHLGLGFHHIYLYDNSQLQRDLFPFTNTPEIRSGTTVVPFLDQSDTRQFAAYRDCMQRFGSKHTWVAVIDVDEFIVLYQHQNILPFLQQHCQRGSLSIHWLVFGTSQHQTYQPQPVTKRFQHVTDEHRDSFKSIIRVRDYKNFTYNPHWAELYDNKLRHDTNGDWVELRQLWSDNNKFSSKRKRGNKPFPFDVAAIYHYKYKSVEEYRSKLCDRGDVLNLALCQKETIKTPTGEMSRKYERAYQLLLQNVPRYREDRGADFDFNYSTTNHAVMEKPASSLVSNSVKSQSTDKLSTVFVISLQGTSGVDYRNEGRLDLFRSKWQESCKFAPPTHIEHCPGVFDQRRGYGVTLSLLLCLERAKEFNLDVTVILEDDARIFNSTTDFCDLAKRKEKYWNMLPKDTFVAFLGGHNWEYRSKDAEESMAQFKELRMSFGAYAFAIPQDSLISVLDEIKDDVVNGFRDVNGKYLHRNYLSPERTFYRTSAKYNKRVYAVNPLVFWHEGGFSNTWGKNRASITGNEKKTLINQIRGVDPAP